MNDIILPLYLYDHCEISDFVKKEEDLLIRAHFIFTDKENEFSGKVRIDSLESKLDFLNGEGLVNGHYEEAKQITINGINVIIFSENNNCFIIYYINELEYSIVLNGVTFDKAVEIASTL